MALITGRQALLANYPLCYACDRPKTSKEHVPPSCFFPEEKDKSGQAIYRKNLITVPACDIHNVGKSDDDIYAAFHLAGTIRGNRCAKLVRRGVIARCLRRDQEERGGAFTKRLLSQVKGQLGGNLVGILDPKRMVRVLDLCARGAYFFEKLRPLKLRLNVASLDHDLGDPEKLKRLAVQRESFKQEMEGCEFRGDNPDVFEYAICEKPDQNVVIVEMVFFGELHRWAFHNPEMPVQEF